MYEKIVIDTDGFVTMTSPDRRKTYPLLRRVQVEGEEIEINCIESYTFSGGPQDAFETLSLKIPKKKLLDISPDFDKPNAIVAGKTQISLNYVGYCPKMVVTKCKLSGNYYTITAYHECEVLRGMTFTSAMSAKIMDVIDHILEKLDKQLGYSEHYSSEANCRYIFNDAIWKSGAFKDSHLVNVPYGANMWTILQQCALILGCRVFFAGDMLYFVDYRLPFAKTEGIRDYFTLDLYDTSKEAPLRQSVVSSPEYGQEGFDTVANSISVVCGKTTVGNSEVSRVTVRNPGSIERYGERSVNDIHATTFDAPYAMMLGSTYIDYLIEPQQSITFETKEIRYSNDADALGMVWEECFPKITRVGKIVDTNVDVTISNEDINGVVYPQKLYLSSYQRNFPEGTSTYSFGVIKDISLSQSTSNIMAALGGQG